MKDDQNHPLRYHYGRRTFEEIKETAAKALETPGADQKQYYLLKILELLNIDLSDMWSEEERPEPDKGRAP